MFHLLVLNRNFFSLHLLILFVRLFCYIQLDFNIAQNSDDDPLCYYSVPRLCINWGHFQVTQCWQLNFFAVTITKTGCACGVGIKIPSTLTKFQMTVCAGLLWQLPFVIWSSYIAPSLFHSSETCSYSLIAQAVAILLLAFYH